MYAILANKHFSTGQISDILTFAALVIVILGLIVLYRTKPKTKISESLNIRRAIVKSLIFVLGIIVFAITSSRVISRSEDYSDGVHSIYQNNSGAEVSFYKDGLIFTGGKDVDAITSSTDVIYRSEPKTFENKLVLRKNESKLVKKIDRFELIGDKSGKVDKIEYGTRKYFSSIFGIKFYGKEYSIVKVYMKVTDKDQLDLKKLLDN